MLHNLRHLCAFCTASGSDCLAHTMIGSSRKKLLETEYLKFQAQGEADGVVEIYWCEIVGYLTIGIRRQAVWLVSVCY